MLLALVALFPLRLLHAQDSTTDLDTRVEALLSAMTVEERVGQLFLVAFQGNDASPGTDIATLIQQDHVGGVVLLAANANLYNSADAPRQVAELSNRLQALAMASAPARASGVEVPLFVAVQHEGDGYPYTQITGGTTPLPNALAAGATWDVTSARDMGQITGLELAAMGVNLLLGPSLDVLEDPQPGMQGDMGSRTFGGDPAWVGQMGRAYIEGVHQGSGGRVATVAKHFPGHGGSDRLPGEDVATVDKSLAELVQVELAPFMAATGGEIGDDAVTDALMSSHIRYRNYQGEVRQFTAPVSLDAESMDAILSLDEFANWRTEGLMVSDSLGVPAVRKAFDPAQTTFPHRRIAKEAFLAGNDLLMLTDFGLSDAWADQLGNVRDTIAFFHSEYRANPAFAARVDESVAQILRLKQRLYPEFALDAVDVPAAAAPQVCGLGTEVTQRVADQAVTLLYPDPNAVLQPPQRGEKILIFTDARPVRECLLEACQPFSPLSQTALQNAILRSYGPAGTGQVDPADVDSLPFGQLRGFLLGEPVEYDVGGLLDDADWILFALQDLNTATGPNSDAVKLFLNSSLSASYDARFVVMTFNAPYYLDTTEISNLSLYLAAYSKVGPFVEAAVRVWFGELVPRGDPPVDVAGINYDLQHQLEPDPSQTIPLSLLEPDASANLYPPVSVRVQAGPLVDRNNHPVRDGTEVTFFAEYAGAAYAPPVSATTKGGIAEATLRLTEAGQVRCRAESGEARQSEIVTLAIQSLPIATASPSPTPTRTATPVDEPTSTPQATPIPAPTEAAPAAGNEGQPASGVDLLLAAGATLLVAALGYLVLGERRKEPVILVRWVSLAISGGMLGYILYALRVIRPESWGILPDLAWVARTAMVVLVAVCALLPLIVLAIATGAQKRGQP
ncbi:MAG: glycoside hydrolase family 3 N-terminal domain-containing protein [Anaerolineae bacterium]